MTEGQSLAAEIARLEGEIVDLEDQVRRWEKAAEEAGRQYTIAGLGMLIGLILLLIFWPVGLLLFVAGLLAGITNSRKRSRARSELERTRALLRDRKKMLAEARARLAGGAA